MTTAATGIPALLTAAEFARLPDPGVPTELVRGTVVTMSITTPRHGQVCSKLDRIVGNYAEEHALGHVVVGDVGVQTERDPDTMRGADVAFYSYARVPRGPFPTGFPNALPELVFEVRSPNDRWPKVLAKVAEYLGAGVTVVCVLDPDSETLHVYHSDELPRTLHGDDELALPEILGDFRVAVRRFFA
jgi:Uma2 family endonuclease